MSAGRDGAGDAGFLGRWSERKLKVPREPALEPIFAAAPGAGAAPDSPDGSHDGAPAKTDAEILEELGLPDPDALRKGDDFSGFMKSAVPAALRHRALRRLWLTDPVFANLDGLVDYAEDFTDAATVVPGMKTAYRLGRGFLPDVPEPAVETATAEAPEAGDTAAAAPEETAAAPEEASPTDATADDSVGQDAAADPGRPADSAEDRAGEQSAAAPDERPARTRGMRFSFGA